MRIMTHRAARGMLGLGLALATLLVGCGKKAEPYKASARAVALDRQIEWGDSRLLVVQDSGRYKTLDSFARESFVLMTGKESLPGLSPLASLMEWLFNREAYVDTPLIAVREAGMRADLTAGMAEDKRQTVLALKKFTLRDLADPAISRMLRDRESKPLTKRAAGRVLTAIGYANNLDRIIAIVPQPGGSPTSPWFTPAEVLPNLADEQLAQLGLSRASLPEGLQTPVPNVSPDQALAITVAWTALRAAWLEANAAAVQQYLARLAAVLPTLAPPGVYPERPQREAENRYYAAGKFTWGWTLYFLALLFSVPAVVTRWRWPWVLSVVLLIAALGLHAYGLSLRWYILGRIPVANMFEAVVSSAWVGIAAALLIELFLKTRVFLAGASTTGFLALVLGGYVLPGAELQTIMGILDDVMLRIHTVMIITAYALVFVGAVIGLIYVIGYYAHKVRGLVAEPAMMMGGAGSAGGGAAVMTLGGGPRGERPILAGALPGDGLHNGLPDWLNQIDWAHLIILNMVFVMLFVGGVVLGAVWADYSWGRPWGWDPKEVFALNTWIIYAILIHVRFVVRQKGLWTAWLSLAGCAMMAFNWYYVNFYINSVHSYA